MGGTPLSLTKNTSSRVGTVLLGFLLSRWTSAGASTNVSLGNSAHLKIQAENRGRKQRIAALPGAGAMRQTLRLRLQSAAAIANGKRSAAFRPGALGEFQFQFRGCTDNMSTSRATHMAPLASGGALPLKPAPLRPRQVNREFTAIRQPGGCDKGKSDVDAMHVPRDPTGGR